MKIEGATDDQSTHHAPLSSWHRALSLLALFLLVAALASATQAAQLAPHAQPELLALAAERPETQVAVIVRKLAGDHSAESLATQLSGGVTRETGRIVKWMLACLPFALELTTMLCDDSLSQTGFLGYHAA